MLHLLAILLVQDPHPICERISPGATVVAAQFLGAKGNCDGCGFTVDYKIIHQYAGPPLATERVSVNTDDYPKGGAVHLLSFENSFADWIEEAAEPDSHPVVQHLKRHPLGSLPVKVETEDGNPLSGVIVRLQRDGADAGKAVTGSDGLAEFDKLRPGRYRAITSKDHYDAEEQSGLVGAGSCDPMTILLKPQTLVRGVLVDEQGDGIPGAVIQFQRMHPDQPRTVATDTDGTFALYGAPEGRYRLQLEPRSSGTLLPSPVLGIADVRLDDDAEDRRFVIKGLGRRYEVDIRGVDENGREVRWEFLRYTAVAADGSSASSVQASFMEVSDDAPQWPMHTVLLFEGLAYRFDMQQAGRCLQSIPVTLPVGRKSALTLQFRKAPCIP